MKYFRKILVSFSYTGTGENLSALGAAQIIQDNMCAFFADFGKDNANLKKHYNSIWVLVKNRFRMFAPARWNSEVTAETYFTRITSATVVMETVIRNSDGEIAVCASTEACVIDLDLQRIRRISSVEMPEIGILPRTADLDFTRFDGRSAAKEYDFKVPSTSIDACMHLNNVEYLRYIFNAVSVAYDLSHPVREVEIHYVSQAREGENLSVFGGSCPDNELSEEGKIFEIKNGERVAVQCRIYRAKQYARFNILKF